MTEQLSIYIYINTHTHIYTHKHHKHTYTCVCEFCLQLVSQETPNSNKIEITGKCKFQSQQNV